MRFIRSAFAALLTVAPCAFAASTFTNPMTSLRAPKTEKVYVTFRNRTAQEREVHVAGEVYQVRAYASVNLHVPVGSAVRVTSKVNSKVNDQFPQLASASDRATIVLK